MKAGKIFVVLAVLALMVCVGCKGGGGGATLDQCVTEYTTFLNQQSQGQMPADAVKQQAEAACEACKTDAKACQLIVDNLKTQAK